MTEENLIRSKINKAEQRLLEAKVLFENGFYDSVVNRLYYSLFYGVNGCLLVKEIVTKTHSGAKNKFHLILIKPGIISEATGKLFDYLFDERNDADYGDFATYTKEDVEPLLDEVARAISEIKLWIEKEIK
jgi:uncharacterized protein